MIVFPRAKINLGLNVVSRRDDGFHRIESVMTYIPLCDILEVVPAPDLPAGSLEMSYSGIAIPLDGGQDLCQQAHAQIVDRADVMGLRGHLHKVIPIGAGLGGGSSNSAAMLHLVNDFAEKPLKPKILTGIAETLGSDVPFFLQGKPQLATGRGEILNDVDLDLSGLQLVLVNPGIHISTGTAYSQTTMSNRSVDLPRITRQPIDTWKEGLFNSMETYAFEAHPVLADIKRSLYAAGAVFVLMSGSGSTVYGLFQEAPAQLKWPSSYFSVSFSV